MSALKILDPDLVFLTIVERKFEAVDMMWKGIHIEMVTIWLSMLYSDFVLFVMDVLLFHRTPFIPKGEGYCTRVLFPTLLQIGM